MAQIFPISSYNDNTHVENSWRKEFFEFLNNRLDSIEKSYGVEMMLDDITKAIFSNKSEILGQLTLTTK